MAKSRYCFPCLFLAFLLVSILPQNRPSKLVPSPLTVLQFAEVFFKYTSETLKLLSFMNLNPFSTLLWFLLQLFEVVSRKSCRFKGSNNKKNHWIMELCPENTQKTKISNTRKHFKQASIPSHNISLFGRIYFLPV
jgi:hypothetical protein